MPILLSPKNSLPQEVNSYLQGKNITNSYIVGGVGVISTAIRNSLKNVKRLSGMNRYETNIKVLKEFQNSLDLTSMYAASGKNFPDALSGSTLAAKYNAPLVLMDTNLSEATSDYLKTQNTKTLNVFGGTGAVSSNVENTLKSTMKYLNITEVDNISDLCFIGDTSYVFPTTALATFEDSSRKLVPVKWDSTTLDTSKAGSYNFEGTVQGYTGKVQMTLKITEEKGNINGNLVNGGKFAYYKGKLYFADVKNNNNIYRMDNYGTNLTKLNSDDSSHINIVKNHIYYHNMSDDGKIYKMNLDGSAKIKLIDQSTSEFIVVGDWIYYSYNNNGSNFYKMKTDGSNNIKLNDDNASCINIINNYIYYSNKNDNNSIYKMKIDGSEKTKVCSDTSFFVNVVDDWIYYFKPEDIDYHLYKIKTNGTEKSELPVEVGHSLNVYDGWIYYISPLDDIRLCKMRIDGSDKTVLSDYMGKSVHIIGDLIFYYNEEYKTYFTMKLDGSMDWIFKNTVINENESNNTLSSANKINLPIGLGNAIDITGNIKKGDVDYYKISIPKDSYNTNYFNVILNSPNIGSNSTISLLDQYGNIIHSVQADYKGIGFFSLEIPPGQSSTCYLKISSPHGDLIETGEYTLMTYIVNKS
ncbi:DUF5050 domain-containing protein [Haloimpatiens sp. FM7330]|uniref:DUF5050 domain-containing protein n=1 Tax=Haloimpatiens sp. FM7330 TaxID=3298610 RepID=UPI00363D79DA